MAARIYGSDAMIAWLAELGIERVALNPGASLRGLHDSLVRSDRIETILTLHEEVAVGLAHGWFKATGRPMAVLLHNLVGVQHASMAIFNAWVDKVPMLLIGGSGPASEVERRPWLDWMHTGNPQSQIVRDVVKLDSEPRDLGSVRTALRRSYRAMMTPPFGPVYLSIDTMIQEEEIDRIEPLGPVRAGNPVLPDGATIDAVASRLRAASRPVLVLDRPLRDGLEPALDVAERLGAAIVDLGAGASVPTGHPCNVSQAAEAALAAADAVLVVEPRDAMWALSTTDTATRAVVSSVPAEATIDIVSTSELRDRGFLVPEAAHPTAHQIVADGAAFMRELSARVAAGADRAPGEHLGRLRTDHEEARRAAWGSGPVSGGPIAPRDLARAVYEAVKGRDWLLANGLVGGWVQRTWEFDLAHPYLGRSGGEGLGYSLPASLGAALAARGTGRIVIDLQPDGDLLYTPQALWTAAAYDLPLLIVMHNNRTYGKDQLHQHEVARMRDRDGSVVPIGIEIRRPDVGFRSLAEAFGVTAFGPVTDPRELEQVLARAVAVVSEGRPCLVDAVCTYP